MTDREIDFPPLREPDMEEIKACWDAIRKSQPKSEHTPRSFPEWMCSTGCSEITAHDLNWLRAGHELH